MRHLSRCIHDSGVPRVIPCLVLFFSDLTQSRAHNESSLAEWLVCGAFAFTHILADRPLVNTRSSGNIGRCSPDIHTKFAYPSSKQRECLILSFPWLLLPLFGHTPSYR